jgi:GT2 family glycosyltransferase
MCVHDAESTLEVQLGALAAQDVRTPWRLLVVDNASTDRSREILDCWRVRLPNMEVVEEPRLGTNWARNRGLEHVSEGPVACCDADDAVTPGWLREMVKALDDHDLVGGALDPVPLNGFGAPHQGIVQRTALPDVFGRVWVVGANLGFDARVAHAIGGFDPAFDSGSDDTDFCLRAQYAGYTVGFAPAAVVAYRVRDSARAVMRQRFSYGRGHQRLVDKHARLGHIASTRRQRWKVIAAQSIEVTSHLPDLAHRDRRLQYLASVAYLGGRVAELVHEIPSTRSAA